MKILKYIITLMLLIPCLSSGQSAAKPDSSQVDSQLASVYRGLFGQNWSKKFVEVWNAAPETAKVLGGMGKVHFVSLDADTTSVLMNFDSAGKASVLGVAASFPADSIPTFSAQLVRWAEFMEGKFNAVTGVITKKIAYKGPFSLAIKYGFHFNKVAPVGRQIAELLNRKSKQ